MRDKLKAFVEKWRTSAKSASGVEECALCLSAAIEIHAILSESQWVPVKERLPHESCDVFVWNGEDRYLCEFLEIERIFAFTDRTGDYAELTGVTHWHAIEYPEPPQAQP